MDDKEMLQVLERDYAAMYAADHDLGYSLFEFLRSRGFSAKQLNRRGYYSHGGARRGSGRKRLTKPLRTISVTLYASQVARLNATGNASKALREILK